MGDAKLPVSSKSRRGALIEARTVALTTALDQIDGPVDPAARKAVLAQVEAWTGAYRILSEKEEGGRLEVEVEVEIDLPRLQKRVAPKDARRPRGFQWGGLDASRACGKVNAAAVETSLEGYGVVSKQGPEGNLTVKMSCQGLGPVPFTHDHAARVEVVASADGSELAARRIDGYGADPEAALRSAAEEALGELATDLAEHTRVGVELRVRYVGPASRIRLLERTLEDAVLGVRGVSVSGLRPDGVVLTVDTDEDAAKLMSALQKARFPGFTATDFRVDSPHAISLRIE